MFIYCVEDQTHYEKHQTQQKYDKQMQHKWQMQQLWQKQESSCIFRLYPLFVPDQQITPFSAVKTLGI